MEKSSIFIKGNKVLESPEFIPSLTSVKCSSNYVNLLDFLQNQSITHCMISAYDFYIFRKILARFNFNKLQKQGNLFFMDSGAFEIYNNLDPKKWNNNLLIKTARKFNPDVLVSLDYIHFQDKEIFKEELKNYEIMRNRLKETQQFYEIVIQCTKMKDIKKFLNNIEVDKKLLSICIPERNLGFSFLNRYQKLHEIVNLIKIEYGFDQLLLHLMGCSLPSSIIKYSNLGIDLFDGIHWQDMIYNPSENELVDLSKFLDVDCECKFCNEFRLNKNKSEKFQENYYMYYALSHNLYNYKLLMTKIKKGMI